MKEELSTNIIAQESLRGIYGTTEMELGKDFITFINC